ncbi:MAG: TFIIB-type zinc ribbon-containing protein [Clostridiales bacterium]|nr:TFIIB-type zinc ribbon-containing protein [Clostridiales bacterium]
MAGVTYKCDSCGAYLNFDPESQKWKCPFCGSIFAEGDVIPEQQEETVPEEEAAQESQQASSSQVVYRCQSCGSEIMTDETTVATHCYYCHSPVVLQGKMTDDLKPDKVLPFTVSKEKAVETFMNWAKGKKYVPENFFQETQVQQMTGVYYPHFVTECTVDGSFQGEGTRSDITTAGNYIITHTHHFRMRREGRLTFRNIMRPALQKANRKLSDGIHPFPLEKSKNFSDAYLTGFLAERRDIAKEDIRSDIEGEVSNYVQPMLIDGHGYQTCRGSTSTRLSSINSQYVLLPTWVLTYPNSKNPDDPYYFAMNGCTGEICGKLPVDKKKLLRNAALLALAVFAVVCLLSYFMF